MSNSTFALVDCNNFFVSCLRLFRPDLEGKPVVALSSNDGCVVARSNEAKELGIPMGAPAFKWRQFFKHHDVVQMSGNFELYSDISRRIISLLTSITPHVEVYSVDESFLDLSELLIGNHTLWGREIAKLTKQWIGVPVSVGIAPSKTLAKLATHQAKKNPELQGVLDWINLSTENQQKYLKQTLVSDVWGVGRQFAVRLRSAGINTAFDLSTMRPAYAQKLLGIHGRQLVAELNGISCHPLQKLPKPAKTIAVTRTFGQDTNRFHVIESALASFTTKASYRLRVNNQLTSEVGFFITTSRFKPGYISQTAKICLDQPTADTGMLINAVINSFKKYFNPKHNYHRAGVWLEGLSPSNNIQVNLLDQDGTVNQCKESRRMQAVDNINKRFGKNSVYYASELLNTSWQPKHSIDTPRYTTRWNELPKLHSSKK